MRGGPGGFGGGAPNGAAGHSEPARGPQPHINQLNQVRPEHNLPQGAVGGSPGQPRQFNGGGQPSFGGGGRPAFGGGQTAPHPQAPPRPESAPRPQSMPQPQSMPRQESRNPGGGPARGQPQPQPQGREPHDGRR
jgi:cell division protease FtsH